MIKYSEPPSSTSLLNSDEINSTLEDTHDLTLAQDNKLSLTQLWEHVVRSRTLPENVDLDTLFALISQRLRNPEWEVRQHALRVLVDFVPLIDKGVLDTKLQTILNDIVTNLGHIGPAVRKGAVDALKSYIDTSNKSDIILHELVEKGIEKAHDNKINANVTLGLIIATPFLLSTKISNETLKYVINILLTKVNKILHQESVLRALLRIKGIVGVDKFEAVLKTHKSKREFEMLCDLYNLPEPNVNDLLGDMYCASDNKQFWNDYNQNIVSSNFQKCDAGNVQENDGTTNEKAVQDKVILETEIKLDSGPAITMKIHEESRMCNVTEASDSEEETRGIRTFKVLADDSDDDYEMIRRTPRRVRFGGEIVKLRTPDSDSNHPSEDDHIVVVPQEVKPTIEMHHTNSKKIPTQKSHIPVPVPSKTIAVQSEPNSPKKELNVSKRYMYRSSPNLRSQDMFGPKLNPKSRIPRRYNHGKDEVVKYEKSVHSKVNDSRNRKEKEHTIRRLRPFTEEKLYGEETNRLPVIKKSQTKQLLKTDVNNPHTRLPEIRKSVSPSIKETANESDKPRLKSEANKDDKNIRKSRSPSRQIVDNDSQPKEIQSGKDVSLLENKSVKHEQKLLAIEYVPSEQNEKQSKEVEIMHNLAAKEISQKQLKSKTANTKPPSSPTSRRNSREYDEYSPVPIHNEIEVLHNLTRSPERYQQPRIDEDNVYIEDRHLTTADDVLFGNDKSPEGRCGRRAHTADVINANNTRTSNNQLVFINNYNSFHIYNSSANRYANDFPDSPIPTRDTGDCLTCSSSGSDIVILDNNLDGMGFLDKNILKDIQCKEDIRIKQRGLEELLKVLHDPVILKSVEERLSFLLHILFSAEQQPLLQSIAEQNLTYLLSNVKELILIDKLQQIAFNLSKTGSPVGVRLALAIMKRIAPRYLVDQLLGDSVLGAKSSKVREGALQILMTVSRIFPSTEMDIPKCANSVVRVLKDRKRKVRQAALEMLAALTQLSSTSIVLDVVTNIIQDYPDREQLLRVVRTRLSRKQLPAVDINGIVRYSTPCGESEVEWLSRGSESPHSGRKSRFQNRQENTTDDNRIDSDIERNLTNTGGQKTNYWKTNSRYRIIENSERSMEDNESDWSRDSKEEAPNKANNTQIWAIDPTVFTTADKLTSINGTLRPLFVIQTNESQSTSNSSSSQNCQNGSQNTTNKQTNTSYYNYSRQHSRGRSFSPPKRRMDSFNENEVFNDNQRFVQAGDSKRQTKLYKSDRFHKSFSSDQLLSNDKVHHPPSMSSGSSTSTSGSSLRSGVWKKDVRSGIPVPISAETRIRFRTRHMEPLKGPLTTSVPFYPSKTPTPNETPEKFSSPPRPILSRPPLSSGSESSGYFTPPAEPHLPTHDHVAEEQRQTSAQPARFVQIDTPMHHQENFTVIDSNYCENVKQMQSPSPKSEHNFIVKTYESRDYTDARAKSAEDSFESERFITEVKTTYVERADVDEEYGEQNFVNEDCGKESIKRDISLNSLEDFDCVANQAFGERKVLSRSEANIQISPEATRKEVSSAPSLNEVSYQKYEKCDEPQLPTTKVSLPGSVVDFHEIEVVQEIIEKSPTVCKKTITRQMSRKKSCRLTRTESKIFPDTLRPFSKTKEALNETLNQMDSSEWEVTMKGLEGLVRLMRHHPEVVEANMHALCVALGKQIRNLRSQISRAACLAATEMFKNPKRALEVDLEELAAPLLHRTADTNKFLRTDANTALDVMSLNISTPKVIAVITSRGCGHQNAIVRCASARLLCALTHRLGPEKFFQLPKDSRDRILLSGANFLMEGSLETRKHAKMMLGLLSTHCQFQRAMIEAVPSTVMRHIGKALKSLT